MGSLPFGVDMGPDVGGEELPEAPLRAHDGGEERRRRRTAREAFGRNGVQLRR